MSNIGFERLFVLFLMRNSFFSDGMMIGQEGGSFEKSLDNGEEYEVIGDTI